VLSLNHIFSLKNGHSVSKDIFDDRSFAYGDGFFETIRMHFGVSELWLFHRDRILHSASRLGVSIHNDALDLVYQQACHNLKHVSLASLKLVFVRQQEHARGSYGEINAECHMYALAKEFADRDYGDGATLTISQVPLPDNSLLSGIKSTSRLHYIVAANAVDYSHGEQVVFFKDNGDLIETMHHNIFIVSNGVVCTPSLSTVGVHGVMRAYLLAHTEKRQFKIHVTDELNKQDLLMADEVFITNALDGVVPVSRVIHNSGEQLYTSHVYAQQLRKELSCFYDVTMKEIT